LNKIEHFETASTHHGFILSNRINSPSGAALFPVGGVQHFDLCGWVLTLVVGWVERQKNGGFRCFNLILLNSHGMQIMWN